MTKAWYLSKTIWVNGIAVVALVIQGLTGFIISPVEELAILSIANLVLRAYTNEPIE